MVESVSDGALSLAVSHDGYAAVDSRDHTVNAVGVASWAVSRDNAGRITSKTETVEGLSAEYAYTYDSMGRLLTVTRDAVLVAEYQYDTSGTRIHEVNILKGVAGRALSYSAEDQLLTAGTTTYEYDADGFLNKKTEGAEVTD